MTFDFSAVNAAEWPWPDSLDALEAAPAHHALLLENEFARVIHIVLILGLFRRIAPPQFRAAN